MTHTQKAILRFNDALTFLLIVLFCTLQVKTFAQQNNDGPKKMYSGLPSLKLISVHLRQNNCSDTEPGYRQEYMIVFIIVL